MDFGALYVLGFSALVPDVMRPVPPRSGYG